MRILMLYENTLEDLLERDSRVQREAESLARAGHEVMIFLVIYYKDVAKRTIKFGDQDITVIGNVSEGNGDTTNLSSSRRLTLAAFTSPLYMNFMLKNRKILKALGIDRRGLVPLSILLNVQTDMYHAHDFSMLWFARFCSWFNRKSFVYDSHELHAGSGKGKSKRMIRLIEGIYLPKASAVITVTESIAQTMAKRYNISKPIVVSNFPKYSEYRPSRKLRDKLGVSDDVPIVLYLGAMIKGRGVEPLISAAKYLPEAKVVFLGHGPLKSEIKRMAAEKGVTNVEVLDAVRSDEVVEWASSATIGISSIQKKNLSYYYSLPNKVGEYIMAGIPIAVSDFPEMGRISLGEEIGTTFNPDDPKDIARAIKDILAPTIYARMRSNVMKVRQKHSWENEEKKLLAIYEEVEASGK
jgi:glycosyltransferase involved in cell wall biosynthesis